MNLPCDCCSGPKILTPLPTANRPGLGALVYRAGTWATFLQTMQARLTSHDHPELAGLTTRDQADPSIALLDAWAVLGDVLTFYQERIANEGYLRTATERRSVLELARLLGYRLRPGVSASVYLAFTLDDSAAPVTIPSGVGANSVPGPGEQMQTFETSDSLEARPRWNVLKPRLTQPQTADTIKASGLYLEGTSTKLKANDAMLVDFGGGQAAFVHVKSVQEDPAKGWTVVALPAGVPPAAPVAASGGGLLALATTVDGVDATHRPALASVVEALKLPPSIPPPSPARLRRSTAVSFVAGGDAFPRLLGTVEPRVQEGLYTALGNLAPAEVPVKAFAFRVAAAPFGHNAPPRLDSVQGNVPKFGEWRIDDPLNNGGGNGGGDGPVAIGAARLAGSTTADSPVTHHEPGVVLLDNEYDIGPDSRVVIEKAGAAPIVVDRPNGVVHRSLAAYGLAGPSVEIDLPAGKEWIRDPSYTPGPEPFSTVRSTRVFAGSEDLALAEVPVTGDLKGDTVELDGVYPDLEPGRWLVVVGERTDVRDAAGKAVTGIQGAELAMLATVKQVLEQATGKAGEKTRTEITLAAPLHYAYRVDSVTIYGNVAHATHGQTRQEVLGGGDASQALQRFALKQPPLTYISAPTPSGIASTLQVRVNDLLWHEAAGLADLGPSDRKYITRTGDDAATAVVFGNGERGARLPTGQNNVQATYRNGIGGAGNVKAGQISLLATKPLGVKEVLNPIRASGGADREELEAGRRNAPVAVAALDRLVSVQDYADFSRTFAGVGKAVAGRLTDGRRQLVQVTIAGVADIPIEASSDLYRNLNDALHRYGDPHLPVVLGVRERLVLVVSARVKILPDYRWEAVEEAMRTALLAALGFDRVDLAQDLLVSDALAAGQRVAGVDSLEVDVFDTLSEALLVAGLSAADVGALGVSDRIVARPARAGPHLTVLPAQIAYLSPEVPATLILQEWKP
jgi:predicted phage baseplate assembly protein